MGGIPADLVDDLLALRAARSRGDSARDGESALRTRIDAERASGAPLTLAQLAIDGRDLRETLGVPEGPAIGTILERLLADVIDEPTLNTRPTLLTRAALILDQLPGAVDSGMARSSGDPPIR